MALTASKVLKGHATTDGIILNNLHGTNYIFANSPQHARLHGTNQGVELGQQSDLHPLTLKWKLSKKAFWHICSKPSTSILSRGLSVLCRSRGTQKTESRECVRDHSDVSRYEALSFNDTPAIQL